MGNKSTSKRSTLSMVDVLVYRSKYLYLFACKSNAYLYCKHVFEGQTFVGRKSGKQQVSNAFHLHVDETSDADTPPMRSGASTGRQPSEDAGGVSYEGFQAAEGVHGSD